MTTADEAPPGHLDGQEATGKKQHGGFRMMEKKFMIIVMS
jgi:hypothetical protein